MAFFNTIKANWRKAQAATIVQAILEDQQKKGMFSLPPAAMANDLVARLWEGSASTFNSKHGPQPHKAVAAAAALMCGVRIGVHRHPDDSNTTAMLDGLGQLMREFDRQETLSLALTDADKRILSLIVKQFEELEHLSL